MTHLTIEQEVQLALELHRANRLADAESICRRVITHQPRNADALHLLGIIAHQMNSHEDACQLIARAIAINPTVGDYYNNLGSAQESLRNFDRAIDSYRTAMRLNPNLAGAYSNLAAVLSEVQQLDEAVEHFRKAVDLAPASTSIHSNLLLAMNYHSSLSADMIFQEHLRWAERHAKPLEAKIFPHENDRARDRRLRIGYVSPDFRQHPVGFYTEPLIASHRSDEVEVFCYSDVLRRDTLTERLAAVAGQGWRDVVGLDDEQLAQLIRSDRIDILVDLAGHTGRNRMLVFARKPAPVQVSYLGYVNTTGLKMIDYALTDRHIDPPGWHEPYRTEKLFRLPRAYACYVPSMQCLEVQPLPAQRDARITFGSLNKLTKVTPVVLETWMKIIHRVPHARLMLHADGGSQLNSIRAKWAAKGLAADRLQIVGRVPLADYFALHNQIDIALDPFPHNGGTTSCDALWMGVPVITWAGEHAISRAGLSLLVTIGLEELVADSIDGYITLAVALAGDLPRLAEIRRTLRPRMLASPLMDRAAYIHDLEEAYRSMWRTWCEAQRA